MTHHICTCGDCSPNWDDKCKYEKQVEALLVLADDMADKLLKLKALMMSATSEN